MTDSWHAHQPIESPAPVMALTTSSGAVWVGGPRGVARFTMDEGWTPLLHGLMLRSVTTLAMADRIGVMAEGRLQQIGTPELLLDSPANMFVAGFMGSPPMNLILGRLTAELGDQRFEVDGVRVPLAPEWKAALSRYGKPDVVLGVRPDRMSLNGNDDGAFTALVEDVEPMIGETSVGFRLSSGDSLVGVFADGADDLAPGDTVRLTVGGDAVELFDPETGRSLRTL